MAVAVSVAATTAAQADGVGRAVAVIDVASASGQIGDRALAVGSTVFVGDLVQTDGGGEAQLLFDDGTRMVVGANSSLVIEEFLFRGKAAENRFAVRALSGAFRFISGDSGDKNYTIRTPTGMIGVRGTAFDFTVTPGEGTQMVLLEGEATLCSEDDDDNNNDDCVTVATPCAVLRTNEEDDKVDEIPAGQSRQEVIDENFPYVTNQEELGEDFQVAGHPCAPGGLADQALTQPAIPVGAVVAGTLVILGGVVIGVLSSDSNNNTSNNNTNN
jgi:hypothetical protein